MDNTMTLRDWAQMVTSLVAIISLIISISKRYNNHRLIDTKIKLNNAKLLQMISDWRDLATYKEGVKILTKQLENAGVKPQWHPPKGDM